MKKKSFLLSLVVLMLLLVSCSKTGSSKDSSKGGSGKEEQILAWSPDVAPQEKEAILASVNSFKVLCQLGGSKSNSKHYEIRN